MNFLAWYGIGVATIALTLLIESLRHGYNLGRSFYELYDVLVKRADALSTTLLGLVAFLGPLLPVIFAYFVARNWYDSLPVNDDDTKDFPWNKD